MKCLITGINGFAASHLAEYLLSQGHEVYGTKRLRSNDLNINHLDGQMKMCLMDLHDPIGVELVILNIKPDVIFHLAAQSFVAMSYSHPIETFQTNVLGTVYLLEAVRKYSPETRVHIASSSQIYGKTEDQPMGKNTLFNPMQPYDSSKLAQDMIGLQYFNSYGLKVIRTRAFNNSGPRRGESFAESNWSKQIALIEKGKQEPVIKHGNLESWRDYIDVRDTVKCYAKAAIEGTPGEVYIVGTGDPHSMRDVLETLLFYSDEPIQAEQDPARMRPSDTPYMKADTSDMPWLLNGGKLIRFEQTMEDLLNFWRDKV